MEDSESWLEKPLIFADEHKLYVVQLKKRGGCVPLGLAPPPTLGLTWDYQGGKRENKKEEREEGKHEPRGWVPPP